MTTFNSLTPTTPNQADCSLSSTLSMLSPILSSPLSSTLYTLSSTLPTLSPILSSTLSTLASMLSNLMCAAIVVSLIPLPSVEGEAQTESALPLGGRKQKLHFMHKPTCEH